MTNTDPEKANLQRSLSDTQPIEQGPKLAPGTRLLGRFEILQCKGQGKYGTVYKAQDIQLDTCIAVKVLHPHLTCDEASVLAVKNEILMLRQLNHPNIMRVYEYYQQDVLHFITLDWVEGQTLETHLENSGFSVAQALTLIGQLLDALVAAQRCGICHRDIKPENLLITESGQLVVADFGLSLWGERSNEAKLYGTPLYAPPEYLQHGEINATTDLYAAGTVIYQICFAALPFTESNLTDLILAKQQGLKARTTRQSDFSHLFDYVARLIAPNPFQRPKDAAEAQAEFNGLQAKQATCPSDGQTKFKLMLSLILVIVFGIVIYTYWHSDAEEVGSSHISLAILPPQPSNGAEDNKQALVQYLSYRLSTEPQLRTVDSNRVSRLMSQLGFTRPMSDEQLELLVDLLKIDKLIEPRLVATGLDSQAVTFTEIVADGFGITRRPLESASFELNNWQSIADSLIVQLTETGRLPQAGQPRFALDHAAMQTLAPIKVAIMEGQLEAAEQGLKSYFELSPESGHGWLLQGEVYLYQGLYLEAEQAYQKALQYSDANSYESKYASARLNDLAGKFQLAEQNYLALAQAFPNSIELKLMLAEFYEVSEQPHQVEQILLSVVALDPNHPQAWYRLGKVAYLMGEFDKALDRYFTRALVIAKSLKNEAQQGDVLNAFGVVYEQLGDSELAFDYYRQALPIRRATGNLSGVATTMNNLASVHLSVGEYSQAKQYLEQGLAVYQELGDAVGMSNIFNELGVLAEEQAFYRQALEYYRSSLNVRMDANNQMLQAESMNNVGFAYFMLLDPEHALVYWRQAEQMFQSIQFPIGIVRVQQSIGQLELAKGNWRNAFHIFQNSKRDAQALNSTEERFVATSYLARLSFLQGNFAASLETLRGVYTEAKQNRDLRAMSEFGLWIADWSLQIGDVTSAQAMLEEIRPIIDKSGSQDAKSFLSYLTASGLGQFEWTVASQVQEQDFGHSYIEIRRDIALAKHKLQRGGQDIRAELMRLANLDYDLFQFERLEVLELQAVQAYFAKDWSGLKHHLRQAELLMRKMGDPWRSFQFDRLRAQLAKHSGQNSQVYLDKAKAKLQTLLNNLPLEQSTSFIQRQTYFSLDDGIQDTNQHEQ